MSTDIKIPTIPMNDTAYQDLFDQYMDARAGLKNAVDLLRRATPNGRDYYTQGEEATRAARDQHAERIKAVSAVIDELDEILIGISDQKRER